MMDEICEDAGAYHSKDMVTLEGGADERDTVLCGYHELRRLMRQSASERAARVVVDAAV